MADTSAQLFTLKLQGAVHKTLAVTTRAGVRTAGGDDFGIGSFITSSTDGRAYLKIADAGADADWRKITVSDAD